MNQNSRTRNSITNLLANIFYQLLIIVLTFLSRRVFIENLGIDFLGIGGLFTNILQILSLAELGIGSAISFSMYKEIANKNQKKLQQLNTYYKTLYNRIALIVLIIGLAVLPFLKYLIKLENEIDNIEWYYLIFLSDTVFSYFFVYKTTIVNADQNGYKLKFLSCIIELTKYFLQMIMLICFKNYFLYLIVQILCTFIGNVIKSKKAEQWYPFIKESVELDRNEKIDLWNNIKSMIFYKFGGVILNNTTNILTSVLVSTTMVGYYSNYTMIYNKVSFCISLFFSSIQPSIGNLNVTSTKEKKYNTFKILNLLSYWIFSFACIGIYFLAEDVIVAMSGAKTFLLDKSILIISVINYYIQGMLNTSYLFRETTGLFKLAKYSMLVCTVLNLILSLILGNIYGLFGILLATGIARLATNIWFEPYILYKKFFERNPKEYYIEQILKIILCVFVIIIMTPVISIINIDNLYFRILIKFIICCIIPNIIYILVFKNKEEFIYLLNKLKEIYIKTINIFKENFKNKKDA